MLSRLTGLPFLDARYITRKIAVWVRYGFRRLFLLKKHVQGVREKIKDIPGTNYGLGLIHLQNGHITDAALRFSMTLFFRKDNAKARLYLAHCQSVLGYDRKALKNAKNALELGEDSQQLRYLIAKYEAPDTIHSIPQTFLAEQAEWSARALKQEAARMEAYGLRKYLVEQLVYKITDKNPSLQVLDLGCGTGMAGELLAIRGFTRRIVGVDMSETAVKEAKKRSYNNKIVYDAVEKQHSLSYVQHIAEPQFDTVLAAGYLRGVRDITPSLAALYAALLPGGLLALTFLPSEGPQVIFVPQENRFLHASVLVEEKLKESRFTVVFSGLYPEESQENTAAEKEENRRIAIMIAQKQ